MRRASFARMAPAAVFLSLAACKPIAPPKPPLCQTIAILPFDNETNNVDADDIMQKLVYAAMRQSVYHVRDIRETNDFLAQVGILDGGQIPVLDLKKLGADLGVQGLMVGYVEHFGYVNLGFYKDRKVAVDLRVIDVATGQPIWEHSGRGSTKDSTKDLTFDKDKAGGSFIKGVAEKVADKLAKSPLEEEAREAVANALSTLPGYTFQGFGDGRPFNPRMREFKFGK
jgi:hypothetical protein